jgi:hypothetical protein
MRCPSHFEARQILSKMPYRGTTLREKQDRREGWKDHKREHEKKILGAKKECSSRAREVPSSEKQHEEKTPKE